VIYFIWKEKKTMEIFDNLYIVSVKNKHLLPTVVLFLIGLMIKKEKMIDHAKKTDYLGDNVPLNLVERIRRG